MTPATGDPIRAAQKLSAQPLPKRFYKEATVAARPEGHWLHLDGKPAHTPARAPLAVPVAGLATRLVEEWNAQDGRKGWPSASANCGIRSSTGWRRRRVSDRFSSPVSCIRPNRRV